MPGDVAAEAGSFAGDFAGELGAEVLNGVAGDLGADEGFEGVEERGVEEEAEEDFGAQLHDVEAGADLGALPEDVGVALLEALVLVEVIDEAAGVEVAGALVDDAIDVVDDRLQVGIGEDVGGDQAAVAAELFHLVGGEGHGEYLDEGECGRGGATGITITPAGVDRQRGGLCVERVERAGKGRRQRLGSYQLICGGHVPPVACQVSGKRCLPA